MARATLITVAFIACVSAPLLADTKIQFKSTEGGGATMDTILIGSGRLRVDADANTSVIIAPAEGVMFLLDHQRKTAMRITKTDLEALGKMMADMAKQMEAAMANMTPEMKGRMAGAGMTGGPASTTVDTGEKATIAGRACRIFRTTTNKEVTAEYCMADAAGIDMPAPDRQTLTAAMTMMKEVETALAKGPMAQMVNMNPFRAGLVPLRITTISGGTKRVSEFVSATAGAIPAATFNVPTGYKEEKMAMPGRGRGQR